MNGGASGRTVALARRPAPVGYGSAAPTKVLAAASFVETYAALAVQAVRRGEFEAAGSLLEQALAALTKAK